MANQRFMLLLLITVTLSSLSGCAAFRSEKTEIPDSWPLSKGPAKQSISLLVTGEGVVNGIRQDAPQAMIQSWQAAAEKAYKDSGLFSNITIGASDTDLRAEIHITDLGKFRKGLAFLSGFTFTLFPSKSQDEMIIKTTFKNKEGQTLGTFEKRDTLTLWIQFFLVFIMPFHWPGTVATEMFYDLHRATIGEAYRAGHLQAQRETNTWQWAHVSQ